MSISDVVTFTRASGGTYFDANGVMQLAGDNEWRRDHDPLTGEPLGILIEEARTNFFTHSEGDLATYSGTTGQLSDAVQPISGFSNSIQFPATVTVTATLVKNHTATVGQPYCFTLFLEMEDDLGAPTIGTGVSDVFYLAAGGVSSRSVTHMGGRLYRVTGYIESATSASSFAIYKYPISAERSFKVAGYQLELGTFPTSYIPTTTAAATRAADSVVITNGWSQPWFNPTSGTFLLDMMSSVPSSEPSTRFIDRSSGNNGVFVTLVTGLGHPSGAVLGGGTVTFSGVDQVARGVFDRIAFGYDATTLSITTRGLSVQNTSNSATVGTVGNLLIGSGTRRGHIKRIRYYPRRLSNAELRALTVLP